MMRFTITVPWELASKLESAKKEYYFGTTKNAMLRDLIIRGLKNESQEEKSMPHLQRDKK